MLLVSATGLNGSGDEDYDSFTAECVDQSLDLGDQLARNGWNMAKTVHLFVDCDLLHLDLRASSVLSLKFYSNASSSLNGLIENTTSLVINASTKTRSLKTLIVDRVEKAKSLDLEKNNIQRLDQDHFSGLRNLEKLDLAVNELRSLANKEFKSLGTLKLLDLSSNVIEVLTGDAFVGLGALKELNLSKNKLKSVDREIFAHLKSLEMLDLSSNVIGILYEDGFALLPTLRHLNLASNKFSKILLSVRAFNGLLNLQSLNLRGNKLDKINPLIFAPVANTLQDLDLYSCGITSIYAKDMVNFRNLTTLYMSTPSIIYIEPRSFLNMTNLYKLGMKFDLTSKALKAYTFYGLESLAAISFSFSGIYSIEAYAFYGMKSVTAIDMQMTWLTKVEPMSFVGLSSLITLALSINRLTNISANTFVGLDNLRELHLFNNWISSIEIGAFNGLNRLELLDLSVNRLKNFDECWLNGLDSLRVLDLEKLDYPNHFTYLHDTFANSTLTHFSLAVENIHFSFQNLSNNDLCFIMNRVSVDHVKTILGKSYFKSVIMRTPHEEYDCFDILNFIRFNFHLNIHNDADMTKFAFECLDMDLDFELDATFNSTNWSEILESDSNYLHCIRD